MSKKIQINIPKPHVGLFPVPIVLVTCIDEHNKPNIITIGWIGVVCSEPPMISIAIRPHRYSYKLINESNEFVVNIPTVDILKEVDYCGIVSGRNVDKFKKTGLIPVSALKVQPPLIKQCPVNLECKVKQKIVLGSHVLFISEVITTHADSDLIETYPIFSFNFDKIKPIVTNFFEYWSLKEKKGIVFKENKEKKDSGDKYI